MSPLVKQRIVLVIVLAAALVLAVIILVRSETSGTVKAIVGGVLVGLLCGGFVTVYRSGKPQ